MDDVVPSAEVIRRIQAELPLVPLEASNPGETAQRWGYADATGVYDPQAGEIGVISSVTQAFCHECNDLRSFLRGNATDAALSNAIAHIWSGRADRYSELRGAMAPDPGTGARRVEMSYIGG